MHYPKYNHMMKRFLALITISACALTANAVIIDDFSGNLDNWTSTVILDANGGSFNTAAWQTSGGSLQLNTTVFDGIEQYAFIYNGLTLGIGEEVQIGLAHTAASQDIGLYVGGVEPTTGVRTTYVSVYGRQDGVIYSRGFDGTSELGLVNGGTPTYDQLFITRTGTNDYELGYYDTGVRNVVTTRTGMTGNDGSYVGIYADVREVGVLGNVSNFAVIPEPSSFALLFGASVLSLLVVRRRKAQ